MLLMWLAFDASMDQGTLHTNVVVSGTPSVTSTMVASAHPEANPCRILEKKFTVRGESLRGVVDPGAEVTALMDYYKCHDVARGDVILYSYAGNADPLIKIVKAVPGDSFALRQVAGGHHLLINSEITHTSENAPYFLSNQAARLISLYIRDYKGLIPADAYLILGNVDSGTVDSTRFGLVGRADIFGKVTKP